MSTNPPTYVDHLQMAPENSGKLLLTVRNLESGQLMDLHILVGWESPVLTGSRLAALSLVGMALLPPPTSKSSSPNESSTTHPINGGDVRHGEWDSNYPTD
jgi:hypothetical protein